MKKDFIFTSESVTNGHPDKMCDQISDAIVDRFLEQDPYSSVNAECAVSSGVVFLGTHFAANASVDTAEVAREVIADIGYGNSEFDAKDCTVMTSLRELPAPETPANESELAREEFDLLPAREQVTVFGFACSQTDTLMPMPIYLAHKLARQLSHVARDKVLPYLLPDGKSQVGIEYRDRRPYRIHSVTLIASQQPEGGPNSTQLSKELHDMVIGPVFAETPLQLDHDTRLFVNPYGPLTGGGPSVHSGLTGRKTAIDTYGEYCRQSGAALSGKDPGRIDRIAAYAARHVAKNVVAAGLAEECEVQLSYSIGLAEPVSVVVDTYDTGKVAEEVLVELIQTCFDLRPAGIISDFGLRKRVGEKGGFYRKLATYGHMGRADMELPWERLNKVEALSQGLA